MVRLRISRILVALLLCCASGSTIPARASCPPPANDLPQNGQVIGPDLPAVLFGSTIGANDSISATPLQAPANNAGGPDVFYRFTPEASGRYRIQLLPWQRVPLRSMDRRFVVYVRSPGGEFLAGARAAADALPVRVEVELEGGAEYLIGVDHPAGGRNAFEFTLIVDFAPAEPPEACGSAAPLSDQLPTAALGDLAGEGSDFAFSPGGGWCAVAGATPTAALGPDHVYRFTPPEDGQYAVELAPGGDTGLDLVLYVDDVCPPNFGDGCLGASDHTSSAHEGARHELLVASMVAGRDYFIYVDGAEPLPDGQRAAYALLVDRAVAYGMSESEPNDVPAQAAPISGAIAGGQLAGPADVDWWSVPGSAGDRVYAWVDNGGAANGTLDTELALIGPDGSTVVERDADDADGADSPRGDLRYVHSTRGAVLAGARMIADGHHYLRIGDTAAAGTVSHYRLHAGILPGRRAPHRECEPNNTGILADESAKHYYAGRIDAPDDVDLFAFQAQAGDRVFIALDGDPERDSGGTKPARVDPLALAARLAVRGPDGEWLIRDISDPNTIQGIPDYPAQAGYFQAPVSGTYLVEVSAQDNEPAPGAERTYELAIFANNAAPPLIEDRDPALELTPDPARDVVAVTASDAGTNESGICDVQLIGAVNVTTSGQEYVAGEESVRFTIGLIDADSNGFAKVWVTDCAGNAACQAVFIDATDPVCDGHVTARRIVRSARAPLHVPDRRPDGAGIEDTLSVSESGVIHNVTVELSLETTSAEDLEVELISPLGTVVELFSDRGGNAFSITDAVFDDQAAEPLPQDAPREPFTGRWRPQDPRGLALLRGEGAMGHWRLRIRDDSAIENGGARLVRWAMDFEADMAGAQSFLGRARDGAGPAAGIQSIELLDSENLRLALPRGPLPGRREVDYQVVLTDASTNGAGIVRVTDLSGNTCEQDVSLRGLRDTTPPSNRGTVTKDVILSKEAQLIVPPAGAPGGVSTLSVPAPHSLSKVEVALTLDTLDVGRLTATLSRGEELAVLLNRTGMETRGGAGLSKNSLDVSFDDDAPATADPHLEPASGAVEFRGARQPDGRGDFLGDAIDTDPRDHMLFRLVPPEAPRPEGAVRPPENWTLTVSDSGGESGNRTILRRWALTLKAPCGAERYVGEAGDPTPGAGICSISLSGENLHLRITSGFAPGDESVAYSVELDDPTSPGAGTLALVDCSSNALIVPIRLAPGESDEAPPDLSVQPGESPVVWEGTAADARPGDSGIAAVELAPHSDNLELTSITSGREESTFAVGLRQPDRNGRGYVRATDACGLRTHGLVEIDALPPTGSSPTGRPRRFEGRAKDDQPYDSGICAVGLAEGAENLSLQVDPFAPGESVVRYVVTLTKPELSGVGMIEAVDCAGNAQRIPVGMGPAVEDCNSNGTPDDLDLVQGVSKDCNGNRVPDECDLLAGTSRDADTNGVPDECDRRPPDPIGSSGTAGLFFGECGDAGLARGVVLPDLLRGGAGAGNHDGQRRP